MTLSDHACPVSEPPDDWWVPISALQHYVFCRRQCALIHVEGHWLDNRFTAEGTAIHENVDELARRNESRGLVRVARGLELRHVEIGVYGRSDVVEFHGVNSPSAESSAEHAPWVAHPVEYKRGSPKSHRADEVQLCAQGLCLEFMKSAIVPRGSLYYAKRRRRTIVEFDEVLRALVVSTAAEVREMLRDRRVPRVRRERKCDRCSLFAVCLPDVTSGQRSSRAYLDAAKRARIAG